MGNQWATAARNHNLLNYSVLFVPFLRVVAFPTILPSLHLHRPLLTSFLFPYPSPPISSFLLARTRISKYRGFQPNPSFVQFPAITVNANYPIAACHPLYLKALPAINIHNFAIVLVLWKLTATGKQLFPLRYRQTTVVTLIHIVGNINRQAQN